VAEIGLAGADHPKRQKAQRLKPALAQIDMRAQKAFQGGDGASGNPDVSFVEVVRKTTSSPPSARPLSCSAAQ